jgi:hypothetical protein
MSGNTKKNGSKVAPALSTILKELETRANKLTTLFDLKLIRLTRYFCAILAVCDNLYNDHFAGNALDLFCFVAFEIEALMFGHLPFEGQERFYKGFISKQTGSFVKETGKTKRDINVRLTSCCVENLSNEVRTYFPIIVYLE